MQIRPKAGLVIKTHLAERKEDYPEGMKVFINLCHSADIPPPPTMDYEEVARAMLESDNVSFKVPLSLSAPRTDKDKSGKLCLVFDAACNTTPFEHCTKDASFHAFMVTLCCEWIESKHELTLSRDVSFPKLKSKGEISLHTIRKQSKSIITEIPKTIAPPKSVNPDVSKLAQTQSTDFVNAVLPHHEVFAEPPAGKPEFLVARVSLPKLATIKGNLHLDVEARKLIVTPAGKTAASLYKPLEIELNHNVVLEEVGAQFDLSTRVLTVTLVCEK
ncbi:pre-RNA processing PIH1/Nop17-domain-containing protein [Obelidium mucronatum]|nr:pre-RNA processing PIH1/Nop17-domain-containing protein [Obelidium mucronatum]